MEQTKALIITTVTIPLNSGAGKNAFLWAKSLKKYGNVYADILTYRNNKSILKEEIIEGVKIFRKPFLGNKYFLKRVSGLFLLPFLISRINQYNYIFIFGPVPGMLYAIVLGKIFNKKVIFRSTMYGHDDISSIIYRRKIFSSYYIWLFNRINFYWAITPALQTVWDTTIPNKTSFMIPNGVDTEKFSPISIESQKEIRKKLDIPKDHIIILSVGFLIKRKGYEEVFNTLASLQDSIKFTFLVVGDYFIADKDQNIYEYLQKEMEYLYNLGTKLLTTNIKFLGSITNVHEILGVSDLFILNSNKEGLPNALLEAFSNGIPTITRELPGLKDYLIVNNFNCLINENNLRENIKKIISNKKFSDELRINSRQTIVKKFSIKTCVINLLEEIKYD